MAERRIRVAMFDSKRYDEVSFEKAIKEKSNCCQMEFKYIQERVSVPIIEAKLPPGQFDAVCVFVNDHCDASIVDAFAKARVKVIALRCAGFNNVDIKQAIKHGIKVVRVPAYSPYAVAEHSATLLMTLNRKIHLANNRVKIHNFSLDGLVGFDLYGKTVGVIGTGKIGKCAIAIFRGFGCRVVAFDVYEDKQAQQQLGFEYTTLDKLFAESDVISLYAPATKENYHLIGKQSIAKMKFGVFIINTSRGSLVDTEALIDGLRSGHIGGAGLDVYENEGGNFYNDVSDRPLKDDTLARLLSFNNVLVTSHQAFLTQEALKAISTTTVANLCAFICNEPLVNEVTEDT